MNKPIIGIISPRSINMERTFLDVTRFANNYSRRIREAGGVPIGLFFPDNDFDLASMEICDGFLFTGGGIIESSQVEAMHYVISNDKPFLAICLGIQTIAAYEWFKKRCVNIDYKIIKENFKLEFEEYFLETISGHDTLSPFYTKDIDKSKHGIILNEGILSQVFSSNYILMPSVHGFIIKEGVFENSDFEIVGRSEDGVIEAVEGLEGFKIGVQFHPEIEKDNYKLFEKLVLECRKQ